MTYKEKKEQARIKAIDWQLKQAKKSISYGKLADFQEYFFRIGKKYGLLKEFRENGII